MSIVLKLTAKKGKTALRGVAHYWSVIMDFAVAQRAFSYGDIRALSNSSDSDLHSFLRRLAKAGFIAKVPGTQPVKWTVVIRQSAPPKIRRDGTVVKGASGRQAMWNAMRGPVCRQGFTAIELMGYASTDEQTITLATARHYIEELLNAGYLAQLRAGVRGSPAIFRLAPHMNTGPLPPMTLKTKAVYDQNLNEVIGEAIAEEERV